LIEVLVLRPGLTLTYTTYTPSLLSSLFFTIPWVPSPPLALPFGVRTSEINPAFLYTYVILFETHFYMHFYRVMSDER